MSQLVKLMDNSASWPITQLCWITTRREIVPPVLWHGAMEVVGECNRSSPARCLGVGLRALRLVWRYRPELVVTTGALPLALVCIWAKLMGARIVWIDSIANMSNLSMSGRAMYRVADLFVTQWPEVAQRFPRAEYLGQLL